MSALGQKQTSEWRPLMSALPPKADMRRVVARKTPVKKGRVRFRFLEWDFVRKNQAESKSNLGEGAQGAALEIFLISNR
jgi:hypothetical protein